MAQLFSLGQATESTAMRITEIIRWSAIALSASLGCYGIYAVVSTAARSPMSWFLSLFLTLFGGMIVCVPLATSFLLSRRRYHSLASMWIGIAAVFVYFATSNLLRHLHLDDMFIARMRDIPLWSFVALPISVFTLILPFFAASRFMRFAHRMLDRFSRPREAASQPDRVDQIP